MRYGSVCSGIEAASVAWEPLGWEAAFYSEIEKFPRRVLETRFPKVHVYGDFTKIPAGAGPIDLLVGGTPCQSFSIAGKRLGLDDPRGNLALEFLALARRLDARWFLWENVPGALSSRSEDGSSDFATFLGHIRECGYGFAWRVLDAQYVRVDGYPRAVPQRRRRLFVVGHRGDWRRAAAVLFEPQGLRGDPAPRREAGKRPAPTISARPTGGGGLGTDFDLDGGVITARMVAFGEYAEDGTASAMKSRDHKDATDLVAHALRAEGFDASEDGTGRGTPLIPTVADPISANEASTYTHEGNNFRLRNVVPHPIAFDMRGREGGAMPEGPHDTANIRAASGGFVASHANGGVMPAVAFAQNTRDEVCLLGGDGSVVGALAAEPGAKQQSYVAQTMAVRRLTPVECERLQGFPDGWTDIGDGRGGPTPDGPRYKALGNSMAINVMRWIGMRIDIADRVFRKLDAERGGTSQ